MADEKVNIVVKVVTKTKQLDALLAKLKAVEAMEDRLSSGKSLQKYASSTSSALSKATSRWKKHTDFVDGAIRMFGKTLTKFLGLAIKGVLAEMGLLSLAMVGIHGLFVAGKFLVKAYNGAMQLLAGGAAAATVAISLTAAAIREQQAAMYAYRGKGAREFGSSMNQTVMAMRNLQMNADLASLGVESLNSAFGVMSKTMSSTQINASGKSLKALMDFGAAGQDPKKSIQQVATVVAALNDEKKSISNVISEAKKLGPEMEKALKDANIKTKAQFKDMLFSGELAKKGGVLGQFEAVNTTLISQLQKYFTILRGEFADFGMQFLEPAKDAFERLYRIISRDLARIMLTVQSGFGAETFIDGFVNGVEKLSNWMVKTIRQYLPAVKGMFARIGDWLSNFKRGWNIVLERLRPFIDGARVVEKAFKEIWYALKEGAANMTRMKDLLVQNEDSVVEFGSRIADLIRDVSDLLFRMKSVFFEVLPFINDVLSGIGMLLRGITKVLTIGEGGGFLKALAPLMAFQIFGSRMMGAAGKMMPGITGQGKNLPFSNVSSMPVTAQNVYVNGQPVPGAGAAGAGGRLSSGAGGGMGGTPPGIMGPARSAYTQYYGPALSRVYSASGPQQLADYGQKVDASGYRALATHPTSPGMSHGYGGGMLIAQAPVGSNMPTGWMTPGGMPYLKTVVPERDFMRTDATTAAFRGEAMNPYGGAPVYQDVRAQGGVYVNERGIPMSFSQTSQSPLARMQLDDRMRLGESMRLGRLAKQGFETGDLYRAGMDQRRYEREMMFNTPGAGMITPTPGVNMQAGMNGYSNMVSGYGGNPNLDYSRISERRLNKILRSRGLGGGMSREDAIAALRQNDFDRRVAHRVAAGELKAREAVGLGGMSSSFYNNEFQRWRETTVNKDTGEREYTGRVIDPGLTARERMSRSGMAFTSRLSDAVATMGNKARGAAGAFQGLMGYASGGRFDPTLNDGKGDFVDVAKMRQDAKQRMDDARSQQNRGRLTTRLSYTREMARIARSETKFGASQKRFAQSGTGRMGTSMGLAMASQYAPEEMRGAMALGGTLSMIDPRLGLAVAGVGGAMKAKSAGAGALAGLAGGAQIGAMFGPWGAAIGGGIGLLAGGIMGAVNAGKEKMKKAQKAATDSINSIFTGIAESASRQFDINRELMESGADMSKRKRAFGNISQQFAARRGSMARDLQARFGGLDDTFIDKSGKGGRGQFLNMRDVSEADAQKVVDYVFENQKRFGMEITQEQYKDMSARPQTAAEELTAIGGQFEKTMIQMEKVNNKRLKQLSKDTGKSEAELELLAQELGVNLYDATTKYMDLAKQLGAAMVKTAGQLNNALVDTFLNTQNRFRTRREKRESVKAIDMSARGLRDTLLNKDMSTEERQVAIDAFFEQYSAQMLALAGGNAYDAYTMSQKGFGTKEAGPGTLFGEGQVFSGLSDTPLLTEGQAVTADFRKAINNQYATQLAGMVQAEGFSVDQKALEARIGGMSDAQLNVLNTLIEGGNLNFKDVAGNVTLESIGKKLDFLNIGSQGVALEEIPQDKFDQFAGDLQEVAKKMGIDYEIFNNAVSQYNTTTSAFFKGGAGGPDWWQKGLKITGTGADMRLMPGDTRTPRAGIIGDTTSSKLSQTMARHQAMNSQLTGKRQVTSSWRNWGLGSINSDHVTGRAYDLIGQNLGQYKRLVHANGGFAEFHGTMANRHLHVVPGAGQGVGDTPVPANTGKVVAATMSSSSPSGNNYVININGANSSPEAIANMVMAKLNDKERQYRER